MANIKQIMNDVYAVNVSDRTIRMITRSNNFNTNTNTNTNTISKLAYIPREINCMYTTFFILLYIIIFVLYIITLISIILLLSYVIIIIMKDAL